MGAVTEILALHGWTTSTEKWGPFSDCLGEENIRLKIPSIPGLTKKVSKVWTLEDYVNWLKKIVDEKKVILMGHSNGGRIALSFAAKYPQNLRALILIDSAGIYHNELPIRLKRFIFKNLAKIGKKITSSEKLKIILYKLAREGDYKNATPAQRQTMLNLINTDLSGVLSKIKTKTLIIWGEKDKITPLSDGQLMHKLIKNSKLEIIKGGHCPQYTHPREVAKIIHEYL